MNLSGPSATSYVRVIHLSNKFVGVTLIVGVAEAIIDVEGVADGLTLIISDVDGETEGVGVLVTGAEAGIDSVVLGDAVVV